MKVSVRIEDIGGNGHSCKNKVTACETTPRSSSLKPLHECLQPVAADSAGVEDIDTNFKLEGSSALERCKPVHELLLPVAGESPAAEDTLDTGVSSDLDESLIEPHGPRAATEESTDEMLQVGLGADGVGPNYEAAKRITLFSEDDDGILMDGIGFSCDDPSISLSAEAVPRPVHQSSSAGRGWLQQNERLWGTFGMEWNDPVMTDCKADSIFERKQPPPTTAAEGEVTLQVYEFGRWTLRSGLRILHLGVEVYGEEHFYSVGGVDLCEPRGYSWQVHRESVSLGRTTCSPSDIVRIILDMRDAWLADDYALLGHNCQDFAVALCTALGVHDSIPQECMRFANMGDVLPSLVIAGIRTADRRMTSMQTLLAAWGPKQVADTEGERHITSCPGRIGSSQTSTNAGLPPVVLPFETEATVNL